MYEFPRAMFNLLFPMVMILVPLAIALPVRTKPHPSYTITEQRLRTKKYTVGLCLGSLIAILLHIGFYSTTLPTALKTNSWVLFFPLWFLLAVPLLQAKDPGWMPTVKIQGDIRKANLERRAAKPHVNLPMWSGAALVWIALAVLAIPFVPDFRNLLTISYLVLMAASLSFLLLGIWICRLLAQEPEPYAEHGTDFLAKEYSRFRQARSLFAFVLFVSGAVLFEVLALILLLHADWILFAWFGAFGGSVVGTLGGAVGIWSSFRRAALNRIVIESTAT